MTDGVAFTIFLQIEASGGQALTFGGDVSKEADVESMIKTVSKCSLGLLSFSDCHQLLMECS